MGDGGKVSERGSMWGKSLGSECPASHCGRGAYLTLWEGRLRLVVFWQGGHAVEVDEFKCHHLVAVQPHDRLGPRLCFKATLFNACAAPHRSPLPLQAPPDDRGGVLQAEGGAAVLKAAEGQVSARRDPQALGPRLSAEVRR